jgi:hypothetical protein
LEVTELSTLGEGRMNEKQLLEFCGLSIKDNLEKIKNVIIWRTVGKDGNSHSNLTKLVDCDTKHLESMIYNVSGLLLLGKKVILAISQDRCKKGNMELK